MFEGGGFGCGGVSCRPASSPSTRWKGQGLPHKSISPWGLFQVSLGTSHVNAGVMKLLDRQFTRLCLFLLFILKHFQTDTCVVRTELGNFANCPTVAFTGAGPAWHWLLSPWPLSHGEGSRLTLLHAVFAGGQLRSLAHCLQHPASRSEAVLWASSFLNPQWPWGKQADGR